ncbi:hypothetical protein MAHJHV49_22980 [Mycobacterium avium subsp. hominissuis]|uniref:Major capsid protein n=1 Tax=Mycobacterium alsense TaxID=324058 RepID=A0AA42C168_9MYCO|nr:phage major capsid protein [Mycobacterium alsense]OQZ90379.1 major capsid protein [Mycobacterium alsense]
MADITTSTTAPGWARDEYTFAPLDVVAPALINQCTLVSGDVEGDEPSLHVAYVVDQLDAEYVAENTAGTENPPGLDEVEIKTKKLYRLVNLSFEQWQQDETAAAVANSVSTDLIAKADASFLGENTSPLIGLLNAPDVIVGTQVANSLDNLVDLIATLEANRSKPSHIIVDPMSWAALRKLKVGTAYNASLLGAGTHDSQPMLLDLPVVRSPFVPAGTGVVVDATAIASALGPVRIATSEHALFAQDAIQIRATWRIGWKVMRPTRIGRFTVAGAGGS